MITNWLLVIGMVLAGVLCYLWGLTRGINETERKYAHEYDRGYVDGMAAGMDWAETRMRREQNGREMLSQLEELWKEDNILDGGEY